MAGVVLGYSHGVGVYLVYYKGVDFQPVTPSVDVPFHSDGIAHDVPCDLNTFREAYGVGVRACVVNMGGVGLDFYDGVMNLYTLHGFFVGLATRQHHDRQRCQPQRQNPY